MSPDNLEVLRAEFEKAKAHFDFWTSGNQCQYGSQTWAEAEARYQSTRDAYQFALAQTARHKSPVLTSDLSRVDGLLGIWNQDAYLKDYAEFVGSPNDRSHLGLLAIDVDDFKSVNDNHGHEIGDEVLKAIASSLKAACDGKGSCYRRGGDEFVLLLPNHTVEESRALGERVRNEASKSLERIGRSDVTLSIGIASYPETTKNAKDLFTKADEALYTAKGTGKDNIQISGSCLAAEPKAQLSPRANAKTRCPAPEISVRILHSAGWTLTIQLRNESNAEVLIKSIGVWSEGIRLIEPWKPDANFEWRIGAQGTLPINRTTSGDLAAELVKMNAGRNVVPFTTDLDIRVRCETSGIMEDIDAKLRVMVQGRPANLSQLAGS